MPELPSILRALAELTPSAEELTAQSHDVTSGGRPIAWFGTGIDVVGLLDPTPTTGWGSPPPRFGPNLGPALGLVDRTKPVVTISARHRGAIDGLLAVDALHREERLLRAGWVFLCGPAEVNGRETRLLHPLLSALVRPSDLAFLGTERSFQRDGDVELTPLASQNRAALTASPALGPRTRSLSSRFAHTPRRWQAFHTAAAVHPRGLEWFEAVTYDMGWPPSRAVGERELVDWILAVLASIGLRDVPILPPRPDLAALRDGEQLVAVVGLGFFLARAFLSADIATSLVNWSAVRGTERTAAARVLAPEEARPSTGSVVQPDLPSPLVLTRAQRDAVRRSRRDPVTVVTGLPGSGKSHTVAAIALDAVGRGERVLLATPTAHAADALATLLARQPGPPPVLFSGSAQADLLASRLVSGAPDLAASGETGATPPVDDVVPHTDGRRERLGDRLLARLGQRVSDDQLAAGARVLERLLARHDLLADDLRRLLRREQLAADADGLAGAAALVTSAVPRLSDPDLDLKEIEAVATETAAPAAGWFDRRRARRAARQLRRHLDAADAVPLEALVRGVHAARARRAAAEVTADGGTRVGDRWDDLWRAEQEARLAAGALLSDRTAAGDARGFRARVAVRALAEAIQSDRSIRRRHLSTLDGAAVLHALPLWVGSLDDIDDLLPARPHLFDLVVLDEANAVDLPRATTAWLRGSRTVVVGDPAQLRHTTFVGDRDAARAFWRHQVGHLAQRLDPRRVSALDAAAGVAATQWLDEHHRSVPHLIDFSARHFYERPVHLATRHPRNEGLDAIDVVRVAGERVGRTVPAEIDATRTQVRALVAAGWTSIGVLSPFRAQADALERMLVDELDLDRLRELDLRVGTVHAFQGAERDAVVLSLGLVPADPPGRRRFVEQPDLFNVMVTRARQHLTVVHSLGPDAADGTGLVAEYLRHAQRPPRPPHDDPSADPWTAAVADALTDLGIECRTDYPVGRWTVDLVAIPDADPERAAAVETRVHPQGPGPHIDRHLQLRRAGWRLLEAWPSTHPDDPTTAAIELAHQLRHPPS